MLAVLRSPVAIALVLLGVSALVTPLMAQPADAPRPGRDADRPRGPGGPGRMSREDLALVDEFDQDDNGWLNQEERRAARASAEERRAQGGRRGPWGRRGGRSEDAAPVEAGRRIRPDDVQHYPSAELYDNTVLRTVFLEFESDDWEQELEAFKDTDVETPATVTVDGEVYPNVGVHFRGQSSYGMVPRGKKRSLNLSFDFLDEDQRLYGYKTLNLLNNAGDASMMSAVLYARIAQQYIPTPKTNFVRVVINGEDWGVYANVQQFDKVFLKEHFDPAKGTRWKAPGSPGGDAGLRYLGEDPGPYQQRFDMKSDDDPAAWDSLIELCRVLNQAPTEELKEQIGAILNIEQTLKFLALDVAVVNSDGYWTRASDFNLYRAADGRFQLLPHDTNEAFASSRGGPRRGGRDRGRGPQDRRNRGPGDRGPGMGPPPGFQPPQGPGGAFGPPPGGGRRRGGGPGHGGVDLDPLVGVDNYRMPLRSRLLQIPELRQQYLGYVREIAQDAMDIKQLGPFIDAQRDLIDQAMREDTKKLASYEEFDAAINRLRDFLEQRQTILIKATEDANH